MLHLEPKSQNQWTLHLFHFDGLYFDEFMYYKAFRIQAVFSLLLHNEYFKLNSLGYIINCDMHRNYYNETGKIMSPIECFYATATSSTTFP